MKQNQHQITTPRTQRVTRLLFVLLACITPGITPAQNTTPNNTPTKLEIFFTPYNQKTIHTEQFQYYWYNAKRCMESEQYDKAFIQLLFCEQLNPQDGKTKDLLGLVFNSFGDSAIAHHYFRQAYKLDPIGSWRNFTTFLYNSKNEKQVNQAIQITEKTAKILFYDEHVWQDLLNMYINAQRYKQAIKALDHIEFIKAPDDNSFYQRYKIYYLQNKKDKALEVLNRYLSLENDIRFLELKVRLMSTMKIPWKEMDNAYQQYINRAPHDLNMLNLYAYDLALKNKDYQTAERISISILQKDPDNPVFLDTYAMILLLNGHTDIARFYLNKALEQAKKQQNNDALLNIQNHFLLLPQHDKK